MSLARQVFDLVVAGSIAGSLTVILSFFIPVDSASLVAVMVATMYYFSRYPWGARDGEKYNEKIEEIYDQYFPF